MPFLLLGISAARTAARRPARRTDAPLFTVSRIIGGSVVMTARYLSLPLLSLSERVDAEGEEFPSRKSIAISARRDKGFFLITILLARYRRSRDKVRGSGTKGAE